MEELEHSLAIVDLFNKALGKPLAAFFGLFGIHVHDPNHFVPDYIVMSLIVAILLILLFSLSARNIQIIPGKGQSVLELIVQAFESQLTEIVGEEGRKFLPLIATVGIFIFSANLIGLVPGMMSPTSKLNVTVACALVVFFYYHWQGIKTQGPVKYLKHFFGPIPALAPLLLPIEIISHFSRVVSLSVRLFGNIFAEELLIVVMASIIPFFLPLPFMAIAIFTSLIQAFVFVLLSCIYIAGAVAHEEEH